jgi:hypothetical protein
MMEYEMNNGMVVDIVFEQDRHDRKYVEVLGVDWRGIDIMAALTDLEMSEIKDAAYEGALDAAVMAAEYNYEARRAA